MNIVIVKGNISRDIDLKFANSGEMAIAKFGVAVSRMKKDESDFFNVTAFGKTAELIANTLSKGKPILITGHLQSGKYDKDGHTVYTTDVIVDRFEYVNRKEGNESNSTSHDTEYTDATPIDDGDIPF